MPELVFEQSIRSGCYAAEKHEKRKNIVTRTVRVTMFLFKKSYSRMVMDSMTG